MLVEVIGSWALGLKRQLVLSSRGFQIQGHKRWPQRQTKPSVWLSRSLNAYHFGTAFLKSTKHLKRWDISSCPTWLLAEFTGLASKNTGPVIACMHVGWRHCCTHAYHSHNSTAVCLDFSPWADWFPILFKGHLCFSHVFLSLYDTWRVLLLRSWNIFKDEQVRKQGPRSASFDKHIFLQNFKCSDFMFINSFRCVLSVTMSHTTYVILE